MRNSRAQGEATGKQWDLIGCKVDDKPPRLPLRAVHKPQLLNGIARDTRLLDLANMDLLLMLYKIHIAHGKTSTFRAWPPPKVQSNFQSRREMARAIEKENVALAQRVANIAVKVPTVEQLAKEWTHNKMVIQNKMQHPAPWSKKPYLDKVATDLAHFDTPQHVTQKSLKFPDKRPRVNFEISLEGFGIMGNITAVLYSDFVPRTCANFLAFCDGTKRLSYKGCKIYQIIPQFFCITGDVVHNQGLGGTSIYGRHFQHENYSLQHGEQGVLTMDNTQGNRNGSQFLITFRPFHSMDGRYVAFGKVIRGLRTVTDIESLGTRSGKPLKSLWISNIKEI